MLKLDKIDFNEEPYIYKTEIEGFYIIRRPKFGDDRGSFQEHFRIPDIEKALGHEVKIMQSQTSTSQPNVLRGIHAEDQVKIITPLTGKIMVAIVDLRPDSKTFKKHIAFDIDNTDLSARFTTICLERGLANSFYVYPDSERLIYTYSVSGIYDPKNNGRGVKYDDPTLNVEWPTNSPIVSDRDRQMPNLEDFVEKFYGK